MKKMCEIYDYSFTISYQNVIFFYKAIFLVLSKYS